VVAGDGVAVRFRSAAASTGRGGTLHYILQRTVVLNKVEVRGGNGAERDAEIANERDGFEKNFGKQDGGAPVEIDAAGMHLLDQGAEEAEIVVRGCAESSTVGGAVWQNLHFLSPAPARERTMFIAEVFQSGELLTHDGERKTVDRDYMQFGYDTSTLHKQRDIVLGVTFQLEPGDKAVMHRVMQENLSWRGGKHPWLEYHPSAGSIFKKIEGVGAGRLIDQVGLKGFRHGDAQISHIHANIMVNLGNATAKNVRELITIAQKKVEEQFGQHLEPEIGFIGQF